MKSTAQKKEENGLLSRSEQLGFDGRPEIDFARRRFNRALDTQQVLALIRMEPRLFELAEVVGRWVWIRFAEKQPSSVTRLLAEFGFHWNHTRQAWQHPCGTPRKERPSFDPRKRYGSRFPADLKLA